MVHFTSSVYVREWVLGCVEDPLTILEGLEILEQLKLEVNANTVEPGCQAVAGCEAPTCLLSKSLFAKAHMKFISN